MSPLLTAAAAEPGAGPGGSAYASWDTLVGGLVLLALLAVVLLVVGPSGTHASGPVRTLLRAPNALARLTGLPPWAAVTVAISAAGLVVAGMGFSSDVAYHVAFGRDTELFTPPHTAIVVGLFLIAAGAWAGLAVATVQQVDAPLRVGRLRVPWSLLPLGVLGVAALIGFPVDEAWHRAYGVDVTMWSPPHLIMILGAAFTPLALWLVLADAGVRPGDSTRARALHVIAALLVLQGLTAPMGEFSFGVPQFQQLYHPVMICLVAGVGLTLMRAVLGRGWMLGVVGLTFLLDRAGLLDGDGPIETRAVATFLGAAVAVEVVARVWGTERRARFAVLSGLGIATLGLGVEWWWNQGAHQPWTSALLPDAFVVGLPAALGGAVIGVAIATVVLGPTAREAWPSRPLLAAAGAAVVAALLLPLPRQVGEVAADIALEETTPGRVLVEARLDPPDAALGARWFVVSSWQHGGRESARMLHRGDGRYVAEHDVAVDGWAKSLLRLHRGAEMMTVPIRLPADPGIGEPEIPAEDRVASFEDERRYLLRETVEGPAGLAVGVKGLFVVLLAGWAGAFAVAGRRIAVRSASDDDPRRVLTGPGGALAGAGGALAGAAPEGTPAGPAVDGRAPPRTRHGRSASHH
jgi:hypothetical protein